MKIRQLTLYTRLLVEQWTFYARQLGMDATRPDGGGFALQAGRTVLNFIHSSTPHYYHFAFNIPYQQMDTAVRWLRKRITLLRDEGKEVIDFPNWNAQAIYFLDPAGNIVEFIGRRDLALPVTTPFSAAAIESVSEIGLPSSDAGQAFRQFIQVGLPHFWGSSSLFRAVGDHQGLFIIVDPNKKSWYPTGKPAVSSPLNLQFEDNGKIYDLRFQEGLIQIEPS